MSAAKFEQAKPIVDFPSVEQSISAFWRENRIFEKSLELRQGRPQFTFYEGPPTANGLPHNGHVLTRVFKDVFLRYQTMRGRYVPRKAGWDTHGLPVEVEVEKELGIHGKEAIEKYGVEAFIARCIESVFRYTEEWERMTERIGFWVDLKDAYVTYHRSYVESVWWALSELFNKGLLYQGHKIVWWWPQGGTALSSGEVGLGYKTVDDPSVYVKLPLVEDFEGESGVSLLIWTTTPWTLPSNQYAAVRPEYDYVLVRDEEFGPLIVAAALREQIAQKVGREWAVEKEFKGERLLGLAYTPPFNYFTKQYAGKTVDTKAGEKVPALWRVLAADFVELDSGTGLVHEAPAFGEVDYELHRATAATYADPSRAPLLCPVGPDGKFDETVPDVQGQFVKEADRTLIRILHDRGVLVHREQYRHEYPFCWRADDDPLIQYARPAWFIRTTARKQAALDNNAHARWLPEHIGTGRFGDFLRNNVDWALSRERYWGTPLNIWVNDETGKMAAPASTAEILAKNPNAFDHWEAAKKADPSLSDHLIVHKPWIDQVTWTEPGEPGVYRRVPEVIDCWFDSGCMPFAQWGFPHQNQDKFHSSFPADYITEAIDQTRGWFYSQLMIATLLFDAECRERIGLEMENEYPRPFKTCIVLGHVTDPSGKKESKSKGNYTPPDAIFDRVAQDFAVVDPSSCEKETYPGGAFINKDDLEALDLQPGAQMTVYCPTSDCRLTLEMQPSKKLPRRVIVLDPADRKVLGAKINAKGADVKPNDTPWLPNDERVTVESPVPNAPGADAFRWFFLAGNPPWSQTRHSLANVRTIQKEFPLKLRNVYAFFTIYANIDGFDPKTTGGRPVAERTVLDRWALSELALTTRAVREYMDDFKAYEAAAALNAFVDGLSNWHLRRSRARYWASGFDLDKQDAYATLYECLVTVIKLAASFTPFQSEEIYQNLVGRPLGDEAPESVHLCDLPAEREADIDLRLSQEMAAVRNIVSLGLRVRTEHKLRVRQPLSRAEVVMNDPDLQARLAPYVELMTEELNVHEISFLPAEKAHVRYTLKPNFRRLGPKLGPRMKLAKAAFAALDAAALRAELLDGGKAQIELGGEPLTLESEDVEVLVESAEGFAAAGDRSTVVVLNTEVTPELADEGLYREILRRIQDLRKDLAVEYTERIQLNVAGTERLERVAEANREHLAGETLCTELTIGGAAPDGAETREATVDGEELRLALKRS